jgi:hypothetical protein
MPGFNINGKGTGPSNTMEVGRKHRFSVSMSFAETDMNLNVKSITLPSIEYDEMIAHNGADYISLPGKHKYKPIDVVFYEVLSASNDSVVNRLIFEKLPNVFGGKIGSKFKDNGNTGYGFITIIEREDGAGLPYLKYTLFDCSIASYDPGDLSYADNELSEVKMSVRYNRFIQEK